MEGAMLVRVAQLIQHCEGVLLGILGSVIWLECLHDRKSTRMVLRRRRVHSPEVTDPSVEGPSPQGILMQLPLSQVALIGMDAISDEATAVGSLASSTKLAYLPTSVVPIESSRPNCIAG